MPMDSSLAPFGQVSRKLCLFEPLQSRESLPGTAVPGRCPGTAPHSNGHNSYLTPPIEVISSILESPRHELRIAHGLSLMPPSLRGWEAFPTPAALTHTRIPGALSPTSPQVPGVTPGSPLCPWCFGHSLWRGARHSPPPNGVDALIDYTRSRHTNSQGAILYGVAVSQPLPPLDHLANFQF